MVNQIKQHCQSNLWRLPMELPRQIKRFVRLHQKNCQGTVEANKVFFSFGLVILSQAAFELKFERWGCFWSKPTNLLYFPEESAWIWCGLFLEMPFWVHSMSPKNWCLFSLLMLVIFPLLGMILWSAIVNESVSIIATTSMWTALLTRHVNKAPYLFSSLCLSFTRNSPEVNTTICEGWCFIDTILGEFTKLSSHISTPNRVSHSGGWGGFKPNHQNQGPPWGTPPPT